MAVNNSASLRTAILTTMRDAVGGGTLEILSAADQVLAIFTLTGAGGSVAGDDWTVEYTDTDDTVNGEAAAGEGTSAAKARLKDSSGNVDIDGLTVSLTTGSGDIKLQNVSITEGQPVVLETSTISYPGA